MWGFPNNRPEHNPVRDTEREECSSCGGAGSTTKQEDCGSCDGKGWVEGWSGERVCSSCDGSGRHTVRDGTCGSFDGKGYHVRVVTRCTCGNSYCPGYGSDPD
jgi:hypothetical protein